MSRVLPFLRNTRAASAAEFVLVLPLALLLLFGIIDVGNYVWTLNEYEKATQMGTRHAVVNDMVSTGLATKTYVGDPSCGAALRAGDRICREALGTLVCSSTGCECNADPPCPGGGSNAAAFNALVTRMQVFQPDITAESVRIEYQGSGLGFAGDPNKPEIAPLVTVRIVNATYNPISLSPFGAAAPLPDFSYSLTLEDGEGAP
ncbi:MAG: TadE/TadG family type IV pilus assembly protein [Erythrobacter sp.]|nr:TadE/TadG family type IV pilus assembly protein [Erythrobacter sp.]